MRLIGFTESHDADKMDMKAVSVAHGGIILNAFRKKGFTLIEIMIALAIIGSALLVIIHTVNYHASVMYENTVTTHMYQLAKEKIVEMERSPKNARGHIGNTGFQYANTVTREKDSDIIELSTVVSGQGKQVILKELIMRKAAVN